MKRRSFEVLVEIALIVGAVWLSPSPARADSGVTEAQALFDEALSLMKAGRHAEACPKLERSQALDPGMGTQFRLAECYAGTGRVGRAWTLFNEVADAAKAANHAKREQSARQQAAAIEPRLAHLVFSLPNELARLEGIVVTLDGVEVAREAWSRRVLVESGPHAVVVVAKGKNPVSWSVEASESVVTNVAVPMLEAPRPAPGAAPSSTPRPANPIIVSGVSGQRIAAVVVGAVGLSGVVVGGVFGGLAKSQWSATLDQCEARDPRRCSAEGVALGGQAKTSATISTVGFVAGGVGVAAAAVLWFTAPPRREPARVGWRFEPLAGPEALGGVVRGSF